MPAARAETIDLIDDAAAPTATRRQGEIEHVAQQAGNYILKPHLRVVAQAAASHKRDVSAGMFDQNAFALRQQRALRLGPELFVHDRILDDIFERLGEVRRRFDNALVIGAATPVTAERLRAHASIVHEIQDFDNVPAADGFDLCICLGRLDVVEDLPNYLRLIRSRLAEDALLVGAFPGGNTLPRLRAAMRAGDGVSGTAAPHAHPRVEAAALGHLLSAAGFVMPVVDVDRVRVAYASLDKLVADLRGMAATNVLRARPRRLSRTALAQARAHFEAAGAGGRTIETFEILHFAAWTPQQG